MVATAATAQGWADSDPRQAGHVWNTGRVGRASWAARGTNARTRIDSDGRTARLVTQSAPWRTVTLERSSNGNPWTSGRVTPKRLSIALLIDNRFSAKIDSL